MSLFLDIIILAVLILCTFNGIKRGFIFSVISFVGNIFAAFLSTFLGKLVAGWIYTSFFKQNIIASVTNSVDKTIGQGTQNIVNEITRNLPDFVANLMPNYGNSESIINSINSGVNKTADAVEKVVAPIITGVIAFFAIFILYTFAMLLIRFLSRRLTRVCNVSVFGGVNRTLGGILGLLSGVVFVMIAVLSCKLLLGVSSESFFINKQVVDRSYLFRFFYYLNIFNGSFFDMFSIN